MLRIRFVATIFAVAIVASGCGSLHHDQNTVAMGGTGESGLSGESQTAPASQSGLLDYREILADPGPF